MELFVLYLLNGRKGQRAPRFDYYFSDKVYTGMKEHFLFQAGSAVLLVRV